jgi:hypothetical protein
LRHRTGEASASAVEVSRPAVQDIGSTMAEAGDALSV